MTAQSAWTWKLFLTVFIAAAIGIALWQRQYPTATLSLKGEMLHVLVADTPARHYRGLGGRDALLPYHGMLFLFGESGRHAFVMRAMRFPIDIVWFQDGRVVDIAPNMQPDSVPDGLHGYAPRAPANLVLELPAGWAERHGLSLGDRLLLVED